MKKLFLTLALVIGLSGHLLAVDKISTLSAATNAVLTTGARITGLQLLSTVANQVTLYDSAVTNSLVSTNGAYTYQVQYTTNYNVVVTNAQGIVYTNAYSGLWSQQTTALAATNALPVLAAFVLSANVPLVLTDLNLNVQRGLAAVTTNAMTMITSYH